MYTYKQIRQVSQTNQKNDPKTWNFQVKMRFEFQIVQT